MPASLPGNRADALRNLHGEIVAYCSWIQRNAAHAERNAALFKILAATTGYLELAARSLSDHISVLALCSRGVFELNVVARHLIQSSQNVSAWIAEAGRDRIEVIEGLLELRKHAPRVPVHALEHETERIRMVMNKHGLPIEGGRMRVSDLAPKVGLGSEYKAFYKSTSKLVHPTSYLVNLPTLADNPATRNILAGNIELFARDLLERVRRGVPSTTDTSDSGEDAP